MYIVLQRCEPKTIIDVAVTNTMTVVDVRTTLALLSWADGSGLVPTGMTVLLAVETAIGDQASPCAVPELGKDPAVEMLASRSIIDDRRWFDRY